MEAKLDELLRAVEQARADFIGIEHLTEDEIEEIRTRLEKKTGGKATSRRPITPWIVCFPGASHRPLIDGRSLFTTLSKPWKDRMAEGVTMSLTVLALNATLKPSATSEPSSTEKLLDLILREFASQGIKAETIRLADHDIAGRQFRRGRRRCLAGHSGKDTEGRYPAHGNTDLAWPTFKRLQESAGAHGCISGGNR